MGMEKGNFIVAPGLSTDFVFAVVSGGVDWTGEECTNHATVLPCPAPASCPAFCLHLETKTRKKKKNCPDFFHFLF